MTEGVTGEVKVWSGRIREKSLPSHSVTEWIGACRNIWKMGAPSCCSPTVGRAIEVCRRFLVLCIYQEMSGSRPWMLLVIKATSWEDQEQIGTHLFLCVSLSPCLIDKDLQSIMASVSHLPPKSHATSLLYNPTQKVSGIPTRFWEI